MNQYTIKQATTALRHTVDRVTNRHPSACDVVVEILTACYTQSGRYYHDIGHIANCIDLLKDVCIKNFDAVVLALWFHDSIYVVGAKDNEKRSADFAAALLGSFSVDQNLIDTVVSLIMVTTHTRTDLEGDEAVVADADLATFTDSTGYHAKNIRKEFESIPDDVYYPGRIKFLQGMLTREAIFQHPVFSHFNAVAKANIELEIQKLQDHVAAPHDKLRPASTGLPVPSSKRSGSTSPIFVGYPYSKE